MYQQLTPVEVQYMIDPAWRAEAPATICTYVPELGWNDCIELLESTPEEPNPIWQLASEGLPLEVWILDRDARVAQPIRKLGEIATEDWQAAADQGTAVHFPS